MEFKEFIKNLKDVSYKYEGTDFITKDHTYSIFYKNNFLCFISPTRDINEQEWLSKEQEEQIKNILKKGL